MSTGSQNPAFDEAGNRRLCVDDYAEVVDTHDEFEGLIGIVEEFLDEEGDARRADCQLVTQVILHIPTRATAGQRRLLEYNEPTSYVRAQLRAEDDRRCFPCAHVAWFDPDWL